MSHIAPTDQAAAALIARGIDTPVVMLNLLKFRDIADYSHAPEIAPATPISGADAYRRYEAAIMPLLAASGGSVALSGTGGTWFIGPDTERWDRVLLWRSRACLRSSRADWPAPSCARVNCIPFAPRPIAPALCLP
jgi:hypothetical protein